MDIRKIGIKDIHDREFWFVHLDSFTEPFSSRTTPFKKFELFLAADATQDSDNVLCRFAKRLFEAGAVSFNVWGPGIARLDRAFENVLTDPKTYIPGDSHLIMTNDLSNESLDEALWFSLSNHWVSDAFDEQCDAVVGLVVSQQAWADAVEWGMRHLDELSKKVT